MIDNNLRSHVDNAWDSLWSNGITNPISVVDVIGTLLMCGASENSDCWDRLIRAVEAQNTSEIARLLKEVRSRNEIRAGAEIENPTFWEGLNGLSEAMQSLSVLRGAHEKADLLGDVYEHVLSKLSLAGQFGQFRTPRHVVDFMVNLVGLQDGDTVLDPSCGSGGFLVAASDKAKEAKIEISAVGSEIDRTVARIAQANMLFHKVSRGSVATQDGLATAKSEKPVEVILANPPFSGTVSDATAANFQVKTKKTELLFLERILNRLKSDGRAAVIVPLGVLTGAGAALHLRKRLMEEGALHGVIELPVGVFRPYTDIRTAILLINKAQVATSVAMVRIENDGYSLSQKRSQLSESDLPKALEFFRTGYGDVDHLVVALPDLDESTLNLTPSRYLTPIQHEDGELLPPNEALEILQSRIESLTGSLEGLSRTFESAEKKVRHLGSLVSLVRQSVSPSEIPGDARVVLLEHIEKETGLYSSVEADSIEILSNKLRFQPGDIVFSKLRPNLKKCFVAEEDGLTSSDSVVLRPIEPACSYLLAAILRSNSFATRLGQFVAGGNLPRINSKDLLNIEIPWPSEGRDREALEAASNAVINLRRTFLATVHDSAQFEKSLFSHLWNV